MVRTFVTKNDLKAERLMYLLSGDNIELDEIIADTERHITARCDDFGSTGKRTIEQVRKLYEHDADIYVM